MSDDKIESFVSKHLGFETRRGCMTLSIDGRGFDLTLDEARNIRDSLVEAIAFEERAEELREKIKDARDKTDTEEILKALSEQEEMI